MSQHQKGNLFQRSREALGTVFGDIGTSVLYVWMEVVHALHGHMTVDDILGALSLIFWALIVLSIKYDILVLRADNHGEGGTFALLGLLKQHKGKIVGLGAVSVLVVIATGLLIADCAITPVISLLGAFDPLGPLLAVTLTIVCHVVLFYPQYLGTSKVGGFFGWFMLVVWFPWLVIKGAPWVWSHPEVLTALNPMLGINFLIHHGMVGSMLILGAVVLSITGGEAKYADLGHFGYKPIVLSWFVWVKPALFINYAGQAAFMIHALQAGQEIPTGFNAWYAITPVTGIAAVDSVLKVFDIGVSTIAAFIASQALITGLFSLMKQAIALSLWLRMKVLHTTSDMVGQIYMPGVNWALFTACVGLTLFFQTATALASAYGIAVTGTMAITTIAWGFVAVYVWKWRPVFVLPLCTTFLSIDVAFFVSNTIKFFTGGYFPVVAAIVLCTIMLVWQWGRDKLHVAFKVRMRRDMQWFVSQWEAAQAYYSVAGDEFSRRLLHGDEGEDVPALLNRAMVFLSSRPISCITDPAPLHGALYVEEHGAFPKFALILNIQTDESVPKLNGSDRYTITQFSDGVWSVVVRLGFMEIPDGNQILRDLQSRGIPVEPDQWIVVAGEDELLADEKLPLGNRLAFKIYRFLNMVSVPAYEFLGFTGRSTIVRQMIPVFFSSKGAEVNLPDLNLVSNPVAPLTTA
jgi:KUP system potassium uptake protein